jgi:MinD-like ATPase involved in chromosome partitioning or flagellar assembly
VSIPVVTVGPAGVPLAARLKQLHGPVTVVRCCSELSELLAACQSGLARAAVITAESEELTATLVDRVTAVGVAVLVLTDDVREAGRMQAIGAAVASANTSADALADWISAVVAAFAAPLSGASASMQSVPGPATPGPATQRPTTPGPALVGSEQPPAPAAGPEHAPAGSGPGPDAGASASGPVAAAVSLSDSGKVPSIPRAPGHLHGGSDGQEKRSGATNGLPGQLLAVWGPAGAPGRTTVAVNVAAEAAAEGRHVLLIDADTYGASIAVHLGLLDESAGLAQACRLADQGLLTPEGVERVSTSVNFAGGRLRVLTGLTRPDRWPELRAAAMNLVLQQCRNSADLIVIDCGFSLESDEELSYDTRAPQRNAATLCALAAADTVLAVGAADAVGVPRLVRALPLLQAVTGRAKVTVLLNRVRPGAAGRNPERELRQAWERFGPDNPITAFLPWDPDSADRALLTGQLLREAAPGSPLRHAIAGLVCAPAQRGPRRAVKTTRVTALFQR